MAYSWAYLLVCLLVSLNLEQLFPSSEAQDLPFDLDKINVDSFLQNKKFMELQIQCVVYDGPCDPIGKYISQSIKKALSGDCPSCSDEKLVTLGTKLASHIEKNYPQAWRDGIKKYLGIGLENLGNEKTAKNSTQVRRK